MKKIEQEKIKDQIDTLISLYEDNNPPKTCSSSKFKYTCVIKPICNRYTRIKEIYEFALQIRERNYNLDSFFFDISL